MKAIIFANRHGNEISPLNEYYCPALLPIGDKAVIDYTLEDLFNSDITDITIVVSNQASQIKSHIKNGAKWGLNIDYFLSQSQESTQSILQKLAINMNETLLLIRGDILRSPCIQNFINFSQKVPEAFVQAKMDNKKAGLLLLPAAKYFVGDINWPLLNDNEQIEDNIYQSTKTTVTQILHGKCYMLDSFNSIMRANLDIANLQVPNIIPTGRKYVTSSQDKKGFYVGTKTNISLIHTQHANGIIGSSTLLDKSIELKNSVVIGTNCLIEPQCQIENSLILPNTYVGKNLKIKDTILCQDLLISPKKNTCIRIQDPVLITLNTIQQQGVKIQYSARLFACFLLLMTALLSPLFLCFFLFSSSKKVIINQPLVDNHGHQLQSWRWALKSPLLSRLPQLIYVVTGKLDLFGHSPKSTLKEFQSTPLQETRYGLLGPVQLFIDPNAPEEEKSLIENTFENTQGKTKYLSLVWSSMINSPQIF